MSRRPTKTDRRRELAGKGWTLIFIGVLMVLIIPLFMRGPMLSGLGQALRPAGWMALAIGAVLLGLHYFVRRRAAAAPIEAAAPAGAVRSPAAPARAGSTSFERHEPSPRSASARPSAAPSPSPSRQQEQEWTPAVFSAIEWRRFEAVCEAFYAQVGLATRSQSHGADGGIDIWLQSRHMDAPRIVQCKHWQGKPVGVKEMREFRGVMASHQLQNGTYVTSSTFTADALAFAKANGIQAQDGAALLKLIGLRTPEQQAALLAVAYEGEYWRPTCASCGTKMVARTSSKDGRGFWGCANYPRCHGRTIPRASTAAL